MFHSKLHAVFISVFSEEACTATSPLPPRIHDGVSGREREGEREMEPLLQFLISTRTTTSTGLDSESAAAAKLLRIIHLRRDQRCRRPATVARGDRRGRS